MAERPTRRSGSVLRNTDFRKLWTAQAISVYGTQITILAVPIVAAVTLRVSPFEFGLLATLEFLPFVLLSLPAGVWVDRLRRRPILIVADLARAAGLLSIPIAVVLEVLTIWQLYAVVFVNGCLTVFFDVASQSYLPTVVERDQLVDGNAKLELSRTTGQRLGPGIAGVLIAALTAPFAVVIDAISYLLSALFLALIRRPEHPPPPAPAARAGATGAAGAVGAAAGTGTARGPGGRQAMRAEIVTGLRHVLGHAWLRPMALTIAIGYLFGTIADSILILFLVTERGFSAAEIGFAFTIGSIGVVGGALIAGRLTRRIGVGPMLILSAVGESVSWLPVAIAPDALLFAGLTATIVALGFFGAFWNVNAVSLRQAITPRSMQGRVSATMRFISWSLIPVGSILGGLLGGLIGLHATIWVGAIGALLTFLPVALSPLRSLIEMPAPIDEEPLGVPAG